MQHAAVPEVGGSGETQSTGGGSVSGGAGTSSMGGVGQGGTSEDGGTGGSDAGAAGTAQVVFCNEYTLWEAVTCNDLHCPLDFSCMPSSEFPPNISARSGTVTIDNEGRVVDMTYGIRHADQDWLDSLSGECFPCYAGQTIEYGCG